jgi:hypothetical protein
MARLTYADYLGLLCERCEDILTLYRQFEDKRPVMLYDLAEERLYAYPYRAFRRTLSRSGQAALTDQY